MAKADPKNLILVAVAALVVGAIGFQFRYLLMKTESRRGLLLVDQRGKGSDCHLVDTKRTADTEWRVQESFGGKSLTDEVYAKMIRMSDGLEESFCEKHPELLNHEVSIRGVRVFGDEIGQDCSNRSCFRWVRVER